MAAICTILRRELGAYFNTPIAYVVIFVYLLISGAFYVFLGFDFGAGDLRAFFEWQPLVMALLIPALTMRLWAEERQAGTLELLMTFPLKTWQAVAGKFLAATSFLVIMLAFSLHLPLFLWLLANNPPGADWGAVVGGYLGCVAMGMMYISIGLFASSLTRDQIVALIIGLAICILLWLIGFPVFVSMIRDFSAEVAVRVQNFSIVPHFESISRGVLDSRDLIYVVSVSGFFLLLTNLVMERRR